MINYQYIVTYKQQPENKFIFQSLDEVFSTIIEEVHDNAPFFFYYGCEGAPRHATMEIVESEIDKYGYAYLYPKTYNKGLTIKKRVVS